MGRVNVYGEVRSESGRTITVGGRGANDSLRVTFNTDNALQSDCAITVEAAVFGPGLRHTERRKKGADKRRTEFSIRLPAEPQGWSIAFHTHDKLIELSGAEMLRFLEQYVYLKKQLMEGSKS